MERSDLDVRVNPSVLDRLIDDDPKAAYDAFVSARASRDLYRAAVMRDLETLLNTRNPFFDLSSDYVEVPRSVLCYGLLDIAALKIGSPADRQRLKSIAEQTIGFFEPRLRDVAVTISPGIEPERSVRLRIDAKLHMSPAPEPVSFNVDMPLSTSRCRVFETD